MSWDMVAYSGCGDDATIRQRHQFATLGDAMRAAALGDRLLHHCGIARTGNQRHSRDGPAMSTGAILKFALTIVFRAPSKTRRIELEINSERKNLCHLQAFYLHSNGDFVSASFRGELALNADDLPVVLSALPSKLIEDGPDSPEHEKYGAIPFTVTAFTISQKR
jgi:hypothetical protein